MATLRPGHVEVTVAKKTWDTKTGVKFGTSENGTVVISDISETSLFQGTPLKAGCEVVSINDILCDGYEPEDCEEIIRAFEGDLTIVVKELPHAVATLQPSDQITTPDANDKRFVTLLTSMGFDATKVKQALEANEGSVDNALEQLQAATASDVISEMADAKPAKEEENKASTEQMSIATKA